MSRAAQLEVLAERDPANADLICELMDTLLTDGDVRGALAWLDRAAPELRLVPGVIFRQARCELMAGDATAAAARLASLVDTLPQPPTGLLHDLAYAQLMLGELELASHTLSRVRSSSADDAETLEAIGLLKARVLHGRRCLDEALDQLTRIVPGGRGAEVLGLWSLIAFDADRFEEAATLASQALMRDPDQCEARLTQGSLALQKRDATGALTAFRALTDADQSVGRAQLGLGESLMLLGDIPAAEASLQRAVQGMPGHLGSWHALAWCQLLQGHADGAQASFERAFAIDRTFGETHGGRALVHALRGERAAAEESIKRALRLDPRGRNARYAQSVLLLDEGRDAEAVALTDSLVASVPGLGFAPSADFVHTLRNLLRRTQEDRHGH